MVNFWLIWNTLKILGDPKKSKMTFFFSTAQIGPQVEDENRATVKETEEGCFIFNICRAATYFFEAYGYETLKSNEFFLAILDGP